MLKEPRVIGLRGADGKRRGRLGLRWGAGSGDSEGSSKARATKPWENGGISIYFVSLLQ